MIEDLICPWGEFSSLQMLSKQLNYSGCFPLSGIFNREIQIRVMRLSKDLTQLISIFLVRMTSFVLRNSFIYIMLSQALLIVEYIFHLNIF